MKKMLLLNILMNVSITALSVLLAGWALRQQFEETFVSISLLTGITVIIANAVFIWQCNRFLSQRG